MSPEAYRWIWLLGLPLFLYHVARGGYRDGLLGRCWRFLQSESLPLT